MFVVQGHTEISYAFFLAQLHMPLGRGTRCHSHALRAADQIQPNRAVCLDDIGRLYHSIWPFFVQRPWLNLKSAAPLCLFLNRGPGTSALLDRPWATNLRLAWMVALLDLPIGEQDRQNFC